MSCKGEGWCLNNNCSCECFDCSVCKLSEIECQCECQCNEDTCICYTYIMREICTCGHREHNGGCCKPKIPCLYNCEPKLCPNDKNHDDEYKGLLYQEGILRVFHGNCRDCTLLYGKGFVHTNEIKECPVCYDNKLMTSLRCKHELCWTCWSSFCKSKEDSEIRASCPLCRCDKW